MAKPLEFNPDFGSYEAHTDLLKQRIMNTEAALADAAERNLPTEEIQERLAALKQELEQFNENAVETEAA